MSCCFPRKAAVHDCEEFSIPLMLKASQFPHTTARKTAKTAGEQADEE